MGSFYGSIDVDAVFKPEVIAHPSGRVGLDVDGEVTLRFPSLAAYDAWQETVDRSRAALGQQQALSIDAYQARVRELKHLRRQGLGFMTDARTPSDWATLRELLAEVYLPEGVDIWLTATHKQFGGLTVSEMAGSGRMAEVLAVAEALVTGAFS